MSVILRRHFDDVFIPGQLKQHILGRDTVYGYGTRRSFVVLEDQVLHFLNIDAFIAQLIEYPGQNSNSVDSAAQ